MTIEDASSNIKSQITYTYDVGSLQATSGTPQQVSVSGSRGNPTTISYLVSGSATLSKSFVYYDTGVIYQATDVNGATTIYGVNSSSCGNAFPVGITEPMSLTRHMTFNCVGGIQTSLTDENSQVTTLTYNDPYFWRINKITDPASDISSFTYTDPTSIDVSTPFNGTTSVSDKRSNFDTLGRSHVAQVRQGPSSSTYDSIEIDYDSLGRLSRSTLPYNGTVGQTNASAPGKTFTYDALWRTSTVSDSGGGTVSYTYSQNDILIAISPAPTGENVKSRQYEYDGLGRPYLFAR